MVRLDTGYDIKGDAAPSEVAKAMWRGRAVGRLMSKDELIIQLVKVALGVLIAGYFFWWSLEVLKRLPPPH